MSGYRVISSDSHVIEPPDLWTSRIKPKLRDRAPHVVRLEDGSDWFYCDGIKMAAGAFAGAQAGRRFEEPEKLNFEGKFEEVLLGSYIPEDQVKDMDVDGVDVGILYPTVGLALYNRVSDSELLTAIFRTYNDWLAEFCKPFPNQLKGVAMLNIDDLQVGVKELERCAKLGFAGAMITVYPPEEWGYDSPRYEPLWATAQDLDMPLSLHFGTIRLPPAQEFVGLNPPRVPSFVSNFDHWVRMSIGHMIFNGVFERYPKLQVGSIEMELSWVPHFLDRMDYNYTQRAAGFAPYRFNEDMLPSDYFHRNVFIDFQEDALGIRDRRIIGVDNLLWGSDYPHPESTFPRSQQIIEEILVDCTEEEKAKIAGGNAARIYHLD